MEYRCKNRRTGRTTRAIDAVIQELFNGKEVTIMDHYGTKEASLHMAHRVIHRLEIEHNILPSTDEKAAKKSNLRKCLVNHKNQLIVLKLIS